MAKTSTADMDCPVARALAHFGDRWSLLVLRNAFHGMKRFDRFQEHLGIAPNILADRLRKLTEAGILQRHDLPSDGRAVVYRLTEKGLDLYPVLVALTEWGDRWESDGKGPCLRLIERASGKPVAPTRVRAADGRPLRPQEVTVLPGPGAAAGIMDLFAERDQGQERI